jgi:hypothetical protein
MNEQLVMWAYRDGFDFGYDAKGSLNLGPGALETSKFTK